MKNILFGLTLFITYLLNPTTKINGQSQTKYNIIYYELGGSGLFNSINYERQLLKNTRLNFHIGTGMYGITPTYLTVPLGLKYFFKLPNSISYIDIGFGATYSKADVILYANVYRRDPNYVNTNYWNYIPSLAYRQITKRNLMYRFSLSPVINNDGFFPFLGFSFGKSF